MSILVWVAVVVIDPSGRRTKVALRLTQLPDAVFIRVGATVVSTVKLPFGFAVVTELALVSELTWAGLPVCLACVAAASRGSAGRALAAVAV